MTTATDVGTTLEALLDGVHPEREITEIQAEINSRFRRQDRVRWSIIWTLRIVTLAGFFLAWEWAANVGVIDPFFFSMPSVVWGFLYDGVVGGSFWPHIIATIQATLMGFALGAGLAIPAGLVMARYEPIGDFMDPLLAALNAMPRVALAPVFILWFGIGVTSKVVLAASLVFFIVLINTEAGIKSRDDELVRMSTVMGATENQTFVKVVLPNAVPAIFAGLRLGLVYSLLGVVVGEMTAAQGGLGQLVALYAGTYRTGGVFAALALLAAVGMAFNIATLKIEQHLLAWRS